MASIIAFFLGPIGRYVGMALVVAAMCAGSFWKGMGFQEDRQDMANSEARREAIVLANKKAQVDNDAALKVKEMEAAFEKRNDDLQKRLDDLLASKKNNPVCNDKDDQGALNNIIRNANKK